jgi:hypothetical protein
LELIKIILLITISSILIGFVLNRLLRKKPDFVISIFQSYLTGLIIIYLMVLLSIPLDILIKGLFYFSIIAISYFVYYSFKCKFLKFSLSNFALIILFTAIAIHWSQDLLKSIIYEPIWAWDARSIWYFKAKQLYVANGLNANTGINGLFSMNHVHAEYPLMLPTLGALLAKYVGYWNEYLPKSNLLFLWVGVLLAFYSLKSMHIISKVIIFITLLIISPFYLKIGYMDVWLGIYASLSILFLIEYTETFKSDYLLSSLSCLIFCNYIKHDASLIAVSIIISYLGLILFSRNWRFLRYTLFKTIKILPLLIILLLPLFIWIYYKTKWNISATDFDFGKLKQFSTYSKTFTKEKYDLIYNNMIAPIEFAKVILVLGLVILASIFYAKSSKFSVPIIKNGTIKCMFPFLASTIFAIGMVVIYCLSIRDLSWHLSTSADRLRLDLLFISLPSLYGVTKLIFYSPWEKNHQRIKRNKTIKLKTKNQNLRLRG